MSYTSEHKAATKAKIVDAARRLFNRHGFEQVSIERIMGEAGLTRGGFYNHFTSKDQLYAETVESFTRCNPFRAEIEQATKPFLPAELARRLVAIYLSDEVLDNADLHCPLFALPGDVLRAGLSPQKAYTQLIRNLTWVFSNAMQGRPDGTERAQAMVSICVGGMVLARTTDDEDLRKSLRASARNQALAMLA